MIPVRNSCASQSGEDNVIHLIADFPGFPITSFRVLPVRSGEAAR